MTRVGGATTGGVPGDASRRPEGGQHDAANRFGYGDSRHARTLKDGLHGGATAGHFEPGDAERNADFRDMVRRKLKKDGDEGQSAQDDQKTVLLAVAGESMPAHGAQGPGASGRADGAGTPAPNWVEQLFDRIEQSFLAEMRTSGRHEFSLHLDLQNAGMGLTGLQISMSESAIDVVLVGPAVAAAGGFGPAVEALAERLRARFSGKVVRIHGAREAAGGRGAARNGRDIRPPRGWRRRT